MLKHIFGEKADRIDIEMFWQISKEMEGDFLFERYCLDGSIKKTLKQIAADNNMTLGQVAYRIRKAERRLRHPAHTRKMPMSI